MKSTQINGNQNDDQRSSQAQPDVCTVCGERTCWGEYTHYEEPGGEA